MKAEYDFSKAERGRFHEPGAEFSYPVYLEPDVDAFLSEVAAKRNVDVQTLVNDLLRANIKLIESVS